MNNPFQIPQGYFSEKTMQHLRLQGITQSRMLNRYVKAMLACKLTLVYGRYHLMMDLRSLVVSEFQESYEHAEALSEFLNCLVPSHHTSPSDLIQSQEEYIDESIDAYKEYEHYLKLFEGDCFYPKIAEHFCKTIYDADDYYTFKAFCNYNYSIYAETLLLYQFGQIDYITFVKLFQDINLFDGTRKPLNTAKLKLFLKTMHRVVDLYLNLIAKFVSTSS